ncbi:MAG: response regulator [Flavipsychrobacter sp.]|nr:response regulator [Flavipsychrobacter sp.]
MNRNGPVVIIEDDKDDRELFLHAYKGLGFENEVVFFKDGEQALEYLSNTEALPFIILSDINMPKLNGFDLREAIHKDINLQIKCTPFLFFTTASSHQEVIDAYSLSVQGFFIKPYTLQELKDTIRVIMEYWQKCSAPNNF